MSDTSTVNKPIPQQEPTPQAQATPEQADAGRTPDGRFAKGNPGGPGNPFARQTAALLKGFRANLTPEALTTVADKLLQMAQEGNLTAARLLLQYGLGKPLPIVQPDQLDVQEWEQTKATAMKIYELPKAMGPGLELPLKIVRGARPGFTSDFGRMFAEGVLNHKPASEVRVVDPAAAAMTTKIVEELQRAKESMPPTPNGGKRTGAKAGPGHNRMHPPSANGIPEPSGNGRLGA
jgi:hypothetical protein